LFKSCGKVKLFFISIKFIDLYLERYDPSTQRWSRITSMGTKRLGVAVAVLDGFLYAIGGSDGQCPLNTGKRFSFDN
jgi:hypothetical protein